MTYDAEGRFRPQHFEDFFAKYDKEGKGGLFKWDIVTALRGQAFAFDLFGASAGCLECETSYERSLSLNHVANAYSYNEGLATYLLLWPENGIMDKDDVRRVFDGSIFYENRAPK